ncbi:hypothetical protein AM588_10000519 [Phytophthora nicotianae]|uniref:Probable pectate lyase F n=1 Tax=Phytophthora nicotianae TaxID=4792 RepID=A0A0W8CH57_PHYNI|nr:hypothetical protein AM588_10000519 [Phytophthora nicotianae]
MVSIRSATVASACLLLGITLSSTGADDSWGDMAQYTSGNSGTQEKQSTHAPVTWEANKKSGDNQKSEDDQNSGTVSNGKSDDNTDDDDKSRTSPSSGADDNSWTQAPTSGNSDDDNDDGNNDSSSESTGTSESSGDLWKQGPVDSSQITANGGGATGGGKVPDGTWPTSTGMVQYSEARVIKAGEVFDGKMQTFERSDVSCEGQTESGADTAVFKMEPGATLKNAIIGKNQMEGVHCDKHDCTIENVWWDDVCEDALSIKGGTASSVSTVTGGGARSADDKVIQHNGYGTVKIDGFYGEDISKLYRSCGTCGDRPKKVSVSNVYVVNPGNAIVTVNKNWNDEASLSNIWVKSSNDKVKICQWSQGNADGEPSMLGDGPSPPLCQYSESDVHINGDVSQASGSTPDTGSVGGSSPSQTQPSTSSDSSDNKDDDDEDASDTAPDRKSDGGNTSTQSPSSGSNKFEAPSTSSGSNQTSQNTPSTSSGTVPDGTWPTSTGSVQFTEPRIIRAGEVFDGKMQTFERSDTTCSEGEGQKDTAVFLVEAGGTLKNAIIGKNQKEGVHCDDHDCTIENVWWDDVCEDALSIKGGTASSVATVTNCGARSASDKVVQHNGQGTVIIDGFYAENFGKLYRSCGTCGDIPRTVTVKNVYAVDPQVSVITVNKNYGDKATLSNIWVKTSDGSNEVKVCQWSQGGDNPSNLGDGPSPPLCQYSESDVHINGDISQAAGSSTPTSMDGGEADQTSVTVSSGDSNDDEDDGDNSTTQNQWTQPSKSSGDDNDSKDPTNLSDDKEAGDSQSDDMSYGDNKSDDKKSDDNKRNDGNNGDDKESSGDNKSDDDSNQQQDQSVMQSEVAGEAGAWSESVTKTNIPTKKCNIRRKRN